MPATITRRARAKLNLALHVTGRRDDGYHTIETLVVFADFGDTITVKPAVQDGFETDGPYSARVPGGPDNLTVSSDGGIVAAVHPSLMAIGLNRRLGVGKAASRIVKIDPETGAVEILFNDPHGELFSAATVAAEWNGGLILGSVTDEGLLFCKGAE